MEFPENFASLINEGGRELRTENEKGSDKLLEIMALNGDTEEIDKNLRSWTVTSASSSKIDISIDFEKPILVSTGDFPDILIIQVFLSSYTDQNG